MINELRRVGGIDTPFDESPEEARLRARRVEKAAVKKARAEKRKAEALEWAKRGRGRNPRLVDRPATAQTSEQGPTKVRTYWFDGITPLRMRSGFARPRGETPPPSKPQGR